MASENYTPKHCPAAEELLADWIRETYIMDGNNARQCRTLDETHASMHSDRRVDLTQVGSVEVSTVFLARDYGLHHGIGPPVLWETAVSDKEYAERSWHYTSLDDARRGHVKIVEALRSGTSLDDIKSDA